MKYNPSLKHNLKKIHEGYQPIAPVDAWLKDYLKDEKRGEGWVDIDKIIYDADIELGINLNKVSKDLVDYIKKLGYGSLLRESTAVKNVKPLKEAKQESYNRLEFETIGGKPEVQFIGDEIHMSCWSSGAKVFKSSDFEKKLEAAGDRGEYNKFLQDVYDDITKDLLKAMNRFDNDVKSILKKYGFK